MLSLWVKQRLVGTPLDALARRARWLAGSRRRARHPELWDLYLEDRRTSLVLELIVGHDSNCVDVGAHIGSVLAQLQRLAPAGHHVAFEPTPRKARWLARRHPDVRVVQAAVSQEGGTALFYDDVDRPGFSGLRQPVGDSTVRSYEVPVVTLDAELAAAERVDLVKIDVEGAELHALQGGDATLRRHRPFVLFECGPDAVLQRFGYKRVDLFDFFGERAYDVYSMVDVVYGRDPMNRQSFDKAGTYPYRGFNYLAVPADRDLPGRP